MFDGERWFKTLLVALIQGRVEAEGGDADDFDAQVIRFVPYHPAGRLPERKVTNPGLAITGPALDGERALCEALAALPTREARWARMYDEDETALAARLSDPAELGETYDPATVMGPDAGWEAVAAWGRDPSSDGAQRLAEALARVLPARWVLVSGEVQGAPSLLDAVAEVVGERTHRIDGTAGPTAVARALDRLLDDATSLVLVGEERGLTWILNALPDNALLRERTVAVLAIGGVIGGRSDVSEGALSEAVRRDWVRGNFRTKALETDVVRLTPYLAVQWLDRQAETPGIAGLPLAAMRFPEPEHDASARTIEVVDLGPLPADPELPRELVARALVTCVTAWVASRR